MGRKALGDGERRKRLVLYVTDWERCRLVGALSVLRRSGESEFSRAPVVREVLDGTSKEVRGCSGAVEGMAEG